jgi:precorrin-6A/cobalt-precorrin-6A reductase
LVLVLGGTAEAAELAARLAADGRVVPLLSLAGRTRAPRAPDVRLRVGGFGGAIGLAGFLRAHGVARLVDATHPYAAHMARNARDGCAAADVPRLKLLRPGWTGRPGDRRHYADDPEVLAKTAAALGRHAFVAAGHSVLEAFRARTDLRALVRTIEPTDAALPPHMAWLQGRGPFRVEDEIALFRRAGIDVVVAKDSGGAGAYAKIEAARTLGLPAVFLARPAPPEGPAVPDVERAFSWAVGQASA